MLRQRVFSNCARRRIWTRLVQDESGVTAIEYGIIASIVATALILGLTAAGPALQAIFARIATTIEQALESI